MAVILLSGSGQQWTGDAQGNGKVALYDASGRAISYVATGEYTAGIEVRQTSAAAAGVTVFNMRGPTSLKAYIKRLYLVTVFDGTAASATTLRYGIYYGSGAVTPTLGATITPTKKSQSLATSTMQDIRSDITGVGLTTTGITYGTSPAAVLVVPASITASHEIYDIRFDQPGELDSPFILGSADHLAIRLETVAAVIGLGIYGWVEWVER